MIEQLPTNFLICRTFGHSWEEFIPNGKRKPQFGFRFSLLCPSCGMERHDLVNSKGMLLARQYVQPDGYKLGFKITRDECREVLKDRRRKRARRGTQVIEFKWDKK